MRWLMDVCPNSLGWQTWLILCAVIVNSRSEARKGKLILRETEPPVPAPLQVRPETPS